MDEKDVLKRMLGRVRLYLCRYGGVTLAPVLLGLATLLLVSWHETGHYTAQAENVAVAKQWPAFTMVYSVYQYDAVQKRVMQDQTHRVMVNNEFSWRDEILSDAVNPAAVGSYTEFKDQVLSSYFADLKLSGQRTLPPNTITSITPELDPNRFVSIRDGREQGWGDETPASASIAGSAKTLAKVRTRAVTCAPPSQTGAQGQIACPAGASSVQAEERIAFDADSLDTSPSAGRQTPVGGIVVNYEKQFDGVLIRKFTAQSLQVQKPTATGLSAPAAGTSSTSPSATTKPAPAPSPTVVPRP
ncbi:MAG: hypothetical protein ACR2HB_06500 [Dehalococcoidia bacterium]